MATFAPSIPNLDPSNYLGWAKSTTPQKPVGDESAKYAYEGMSTAVAGITNIADSLVKGDIKNEVRDRVDLEQQAYITGLEKSATDVAGVNQGKPLDLLAQADSDVPQTVKQGTKDIEMIANARKDGKINDTQYTGRLWSTLKQLRAQYPGYRDYVDEKMKEATGMDIANTYYKNIMSDLNANKGEAEKSFERTASALHSMAIEGVSDSNKVSASTMYTAMMNKQVTPEQALSWMNRVKAAEFEQKGLDRDRKNKDYNQHDLAQTHEGELSDVVTKNTQNAISSILITTGAGDKIRWGDFLEKYVVGKNPADIDPAMIQQAMTQLQATLTEVTNSGIVYANKNGMNKTIPDKIKATIDNSTFALKQAIDAFANKDVGHAFISMRYSEQMVDATKAGLLSSSETGPALKTFAALAKLDPTKVFIGELATRIHKQNLTPAIESYVSKQAYDMATNNGQLYDKILDIAIKKSAQISDDSKAKAVTTLLETPLVIGKPETPDKIRLNLSNTVYGKDHDKILDLIQKDGVDSSGRKIQGQSDAFHMMFSDNITRRMYELNSKYGQYGADAWANYRSAAENDAQKLIVEDLRKMEQAGKDSRVKINYDSSTSSFFIEKTPPKTKTVPSDYSSLRDPNVEDAYLRLMETRLNNVNNTLKVLHEIGRHTGEGPEAYTARVLSFAGADENIGIQTKMLNALRILSTAGKPIFGGK